MRNAGQYSYEIVDWFKLKPLADNKTNVNVKFAFGKGRKHCGQWRKCWFPAFSPFPTMFSKGFCLKIV